MNKKDYIACARKVLADESKAIENILPLIDESFVAAVEQILSLPREGRLVVCGMGKAGFIAMKVSATFASTGVPSFFLHPAEAVHGDLGRFTDSDTALILSNSGETEEVIRILPHVKRTGCPIIAITGALESSLSKHSDIVLPLGDITEAGRFALAPTSSTTAMLALCDALAMCVLEQQHFSPEKFAKFHPGGKLGRSLLVVSEMMRKDKELCIVKTGATIREVVTAISATPGRPGCAAIVDERGSLSGIFTDGDVRRVFSEKSVSLDEPVDNYMGKSPKVIRPSQLVQEGMHLMSQHRIDQLIVTNEKNQPVGMIDIQDLMAISSR
jgi:arabinose-5-phosphate isomerase